MRQQGFVFYLIAAVALGFFIPLPEESATRMWVAYSGNFAIIAVFFLQGLSLTRGKMLSGVRPFRLHLFVLGWNFLFFPFLVLILNTLLPDLLGPELRMGLWMLAILPTTIASASALTVSSHGAVPQCIFSSIISNLLALLAVPLLAMAYLKSVESAEFRLIPVLLELCWLVLLPLITGQILRRVFRELVTPVSEMSRWIPQVAILYIVYLSFAQTASSGMLETLPTRSLLSALSAVICLLLLVSWLVWLSSKWVQLSNDQRIAGFFCASQKSVATGLPLVTTIIGTAMQSSDVGVILIPLLIYHSLQLLLGGILVPHFAAKR